MSFNKRFFSEKNIRLHAESDFGSFDMYMLKPDAAISTDKWSGDFYRTYSDSDEESRKQIHKNLKNENN
jgi:hypothetical protein